MCFLTFLLSSKFLLFFFFIIFFEHIHFKKPKKINKNLHIKNKEELNFDNIIFIELFFEK